MGFVHFFHETLLKPSVINTGVKSSCRRPRLFPHQLFSRAKVPAKRHLRVAFKHLLAYFHPESLWWKWIPNFWRIGITSGIASSIYWDWVFSQHFWGRWVSTAPPTIANHQLTGHAFEHPLRQRWLESQESLAQGRFWWGRKLLIFTG